jgi:hypothetical protein
MRVTSVALLTFLVAACTVGEEYIPARGDEHATLVLSGPELDAELKSSPTHVTQHAFRRVGVMFDADKPTALEVATSVDGVTWTEWRTVDLRNVEVEGSASFLGEVAADGEAKHFKLRGNATYVRIDVLASVADEWEGNDNDVGDALEPGTASLTGVTIKSRAEWQARTASCTTTHTPKKLTVHHTDTPNNDTLSVPARLRQIQSYHRDVRGWCDIGYHFLISADGQIWEGRPITRLGAHTAGANTNNIGISLIGTFEATPPSAAALGATAALIRSIGAQYNITLSRTTVKGHREQGTTATDCPGAKTFALLPQIVANANQGDTSPPPPPAMLDRVEGVIYEGTDPSARLAGATVTIAGKSTTTSATGTYVIEGVTPGVHTVTISKSGYTAQTLSRDTRTSTFISAGLTKVLATGTAVLQGVIYRGTNGMDRIPNATITLSTGKVIKADANGYYITNQLPSGPITITASASGFTTASVQRTLVNGQTEWGSVSLK